jgi:hypothetical protein
MVRHVAANRTQFLRNRSPLKKAGNPSRAAGIEIDRLERGQLPCTSNLKILVVPSEFQSNARPRVSLVTAKSVLASWFVVTHLDSMTMSEWLKKLIKTLPRERRSTK